MRGFGCKSLHRFKVIGWRGAQRHSKLAGQNRHGCARPGPPCPGAMSGWVAAGKPPASSGVRAGVPSRHGHHLVPVHAPSLGVRLQQVMPLGHCGDSGPGRSQGTPDSQGHPGVISCTVRSTLLSVAWHPQHRLAAPPSIRSPQPWSRSPQSWGCGYQVSCTSLAGRMPLGGPSLTLGSQMDQDGAEETSDQRCQVCQANLMPPNSPTLLLSPP